MYGLRYYMGGQDHTGARPDRHALVRSLFYADRCEQSKKQKKSLPTPDPHTCFTSATWDASFCIGMGS